MKKSCQEAKSRAEMLINEDSTDKQALQDVCFSLADFELDAPEIPALREKLREKINQLPQEIQGELRKGLAEPTKEKDEFDAPEWKRYFEGKPTEEIEKLKAMLKSSQSAPSSRVKAENKLAILIVSIVVGSLLILPVVDFFDRRRKRPRPSGLVEIGNGSYTTKRAIKSRGKEVAMTHAKETNVKVERKGIGISYDQVMESLSDFFTMQKAKPVNGKDRYMGATSSETAVLEIVGSKNNVSSAKLQFGIPNDNQKALVGNSMILAIFLKNTCPEWREAEDWVNREISKLTRARKTDKEITKGKKKIRLIFPDRFGLITVSVKPSIKAAVFEKPFKKKEKTADKKSGYEKAMGNYKKAYREGADFEERKKYIDKIVEEILK